MSTEETKCQRLMDYTDWTKKQLLNRIYQLEGRGVVFPDSQLKKNAQREEKDKDTLNLKISKQEKKKIFDFSKYTKRKIALRFSYLGWNYQGLALQGEETDLPTVEEKIMEALYKVKLIGSLDQNDCEFSRCGRTDKGVSAMNQVISLIVRSKLSEEEIKNPENDDNEIDYIKTINHSLPDDIRIHSICLRPPKTFDARFDCTYRHYKYIFNGNNLDITAMNEAAKHFLGENDFRNFCKIDASKQIYNFKRTILMSQIDKIPGEDNFFVFNLKGTAFLWHQVRCMVAVLLTVAQKHEDPSIVKELLDIEKYPSRPVYKMAHDIPLVLYDCGFDSNLIKWSTGPDRKFNVNKVVDGIWNDYKIKSIISDFMKSFTEETNDEKSGKTYVNLGDGIGQSMNSYIKYSKRNRLETAEKINSKWKGKRDPSANKRRKTDHVE